jgi:L-threonylcarbamoyladenylate synthase
MFWHGRVTSPGGDDAWREEAVEILRRDGVLAFPTDTLYGLAVDPRSERAIEKLYLIKRRSVDQGIPLIAADEAQLLQAGAVLSPLAARLAARFWPGPLTILVPAWPALTPALLAGRSQVAVRVPDHPVAHALAAAFGYPLTSTSANRSGHPATQIPAEVVAALGADLDGIVDAGVCPGGPPSTIVDVCDGALRLVRAGAVPWERVLESMR